MAYLDEKGLARFWGKIKNALSKKQDTLNEGDGIVIEGDAISVALPTKALTKAEYDMLSESEKMADVEYIITDDDSDNDLRGGIPYGCILIWSGASNAVPDGWALCDGTNGTPDLRGRFVLGESESHEMGSTGGSEEVALYTHQMPHHFHSVYAGTNSGSVTQRLHIAAALNRANYDGDYTNTGPVGEGQPHPNMPPYYVLCYIMKL